jgi:hypothetical protein
MLLKGQHDMAANRLMTAARAGTNTTFTTSAVSQATAAFGAQTYLIRVATATNPCYLKIGDGTPTAAATDMVVGVNVESYFAVSPGQKAAVLQNTAAGQVSITEMS